MDIHCIAIGMNAPEKKVFSSIFLCFKQEPDNVQINYQD